MAIGKVIKSDSPVESDRAAPARPRGVLDAEDFEARQQAQGIVAKARRDAADIVADAESRKAEYVAQGHEIGRQEILVQSQEILAKAHLQRDQMIVDAEKEILKLALRVAEKIIGRDLERSPEVIADICATAIEYTRNVKAMVLRVNPRDAGELRAHHQDLLDRVGQLAAIAIKEDADVARGGVIIQTEGGTTDAQLSTQLEMLQNILLAPDQPRDEEHE
jgi:type III secretion protein L